MIRPSSSLLQPRAAVISMAALGALDGISEALAAPTVAFSLHEEEATHLLVLGNPLPSPFAASAVLAGGRLLFAKPDSNCFAEGSQPLPDPNPGVCTLRLRDYSEPVLVPGTPVPLSDFLSVNWTPALPILRTASLPEIGVKLRASSAIQPTAALALTGAEVSDLEESLSAYPETRFRGVSFTFDGREVILRSPDPRFLEGIAGTAFHALELEARKTLYLPLGHELTPVYAKAWLHDLLGPQGDLFFWRREYIQSVNSTDLMSLNRRTWRSRRLADGPR